MPDDFDAPSTPEEDAVTAALLKGLRDYPLDGFMREGQPAQPVPETNE